MVSRNCCTQSRPRFPRADFMGSRESASRFLAVLERAGVVTQGRGRLTVHDPAALGRYVY